MGIIGQVEVGTRDGVDEAAVDEELGEPDLRHLERRRPALLLRLHIRRRPVRAAAAVHLAPHRPPRSTRLLWGLGCARCDERRRGRGPASCAVI